MIHSMLARVALAFLALTTGGFQLVDGVHVLVKGKYIGTETPGPWRHVVAVLGVDPFAIGPLFVVLGGCWLAAATALLATSSTIAWWALLAVAVMTLWYLPVGTATACATLAILILTRSSLTGAT
jgi:hypothetical protein